MYAIYIYIHICICIWVVVKIMVPFGVPILIRHLVFRVPKGGPRDAKPTIILLGLGFRV